MKVFLRRWRWLIAAAVLAGAAATLRRSPQPIPSWAMRDAMASQPPLSLAHAGLGGEGSSCKLCHLSSSGFAAPSTAVCLSCHDGSLASSVSVHAHPVGIEYALSLRSAPDRFNDPAARADIHLESGAIGCVSCHRVHQQPEGSSRTGVVESACEACHRL